MKCNYAAVLLSVTLGVSLLSGCSGGSTDTGATDGKIYGEVKETDGDTITIAVGALQEQHNKDEQAKHLSLDLTGETKEITVTEDTEITRRGMGSAPGQEGMPPGEQPEGEAPDKPEGEAPDKPEGEAPDKPEGEAPDKPEGEGEAPNMPADEQKENITVEDISENDILEITVGDDGDAEEITVLTAGGGRGGQASAVISYEAVTEYTEDADVDGDAFASSGTDENAILVSGDAAVTLKNISALRNSSDSTGGDNSSFYGIGAAILGTDGTTTISESDIQTDSAGGAGVFAYGDGTVHVSDTSISTRQDTSGGIHAAGGGALYASDLTVTTEGESSAAIRSDRGGGTMVVDGGSYTSNGVNSPVIYSTAEIAVNDAKLTANGSEAICIEGRNSVHLFDCDLSGKMSDNEQNDCTWNVILYQSMSGDSQEGNSIFEMNGGTLTAKNGGMFYTTNTESTVTLSDVDITYADDSEFFLRCTGNGNKRGWGTSGANGADCLFTAINQEMKGDLIWDSISNLDFYITDGSNLTGAVTNDETYAGDGGEGYCDLYIEKGSSWTVTGDSMVSELQCAGSITDKDGKTVTIKGNDGTVYRKGDSSFTITVDSYRTGTDVSGASGTTTFSDYTK